MKLNRMKIFFFNFYFCTLVIDRLTCAKRIQLFTGEISFRRYLQHKLCQNKPFVLVENLQFNNEIAAEPNISIRPQIDRVLKQSPKCKYDQLANVDIRQVRAQMPSIEIYVYFRTKQFIFDLSNFRIANRSTFAQVLQALGQFYDHCSPCAPFLVLFDHSLGPQRLFEWSLFAQSQVSSTFQSALIADLDSTMVTVLWRPVFDGCRSTEPIFWPRSFSDFARLNVDFFNCDLHSITLNVSVNQYMPLCGFTYDSANNQLIGQYSVEIEFLKLLAAHYNFKYQLIDGKQVWGMLDPAKGTWNGVYEQVINGISNMALCGVIRNIPAYSVIDFTRHTLFTGLAFISHSPKRLEATQMIAPTLFTATWCGLVAAFFLLALMLYGSLRRSHPFACVLQMFFAITMRQSEKRLISSLRTDSSRLLCAAWILTTMIVYNFYGSTFFSVLTISKYGSAIDTIDDLVREASTDRCQVVVARDSAFHQRLVHTGPENSVWYTIGRHLNRTMPNGLLKPDKNIIEFVEQNSKRVGISFRYYLVNQRNSKATKPLYIGSHDFWKVTIGVMLPKRSPLLYPFNHVIVQLHEHGNFIYWLKRSGAVDEYGNENNRAIFETMKAISVQDIAWLFKLYLYVYPIAAFVLLIEIGVRWRWLAIDGAKTPGS